MKMTNTALEGCFIFEPTVLSDERGHFMETFNEKSFESITGITTTFVQDNQSFSFKGVLRGLHYQTGLHSQAKLVRVLSGEVLDVAVDLRPESDTFGQYISVLLTATNKKQLYIPRGFAHGFIVRSETADFFYKCDNYFNRESEGGILYNDSTIGIDWECNEKILVSEKDRQLPNLKNARAVW